MMNDKIAFLERVKATSTKYSSEKYWVIGENASELHMNWKT